MNKQIVISIIVICIIMLCLAAPALADGPTTRPEAWETAAATKAAYVEQVRPTVMPTPWAYPAPAPYPEPEGVAWWEWLEAVIDWIAE